MPPVREPGTMPDLKRPKRAARKKPVRAAPRTEHIPDPRKPKAPSPRQVKQAETQEAQYVSQGRAVKKAAKQQKRPATKIAAKVPGLAQAREVERELKKVPPAQRPKVARQIAVRQRETNLPEPKREKGRGIKGPAILYSTNPAALAAAGFKSDKIDKALQIPGRAMANAPGDAAEIVTTTPSSMAKLASTAVHHPTKVPGMLIEPYKELAKNPAEFIAENPVSAALMLNPAVRLPGRAVGKVARVTGKQTLARPAATLPATGLKEARTGSRDVLVRHRQSRADKRTGTLKMSDEQVAKRADEFYDQSLKHRQRVKKAATKDAKALPKEQRADHVSGAAGGAGHHVDRRFAQEFGATWQRTPGGGGVVKPKGATGGHLHNSRADAEAIAAKVPFDAVVRDAGPGQYAVVPKVAAKRISKHEAVGTSAAVGAKVFRVSGKLFRGAVLPTSTKWLTGQAVEAGIRSGVAGAGPMSLLRERRIFKAMEKDTPGSGVKFRQRTSGGGQFGLTGAAREFLDGGRTLAQEFEGTSLQRGARAATKAGAAPGVRQVRQGWHQYSRFVFDTVNGAFEQTAQRAMAGKAVKTGPLMDRRVLALSDKAIQDAARGLKATENQVELGRAIERMYGSYSKFSPEKRETLLHTTPFYPWYRNSVTFLTKVLPVDHPAIAALVADANVLEEDWRKRHHQSLHDPDHAPGFLLGGYPVGGGKTVRLGKYTPFGVASDPAQSVADLALPQFSGAQEALRGIDFTGHRMKHPGYSGKEFTLAERLAAAAVAEAQVLVPGSGQAGRISGVVPKYIDKKDVPVGRKGIARRVRKEFDPFMAAGGTPKKATRKRKSGGGGYPGFGGGGGSSSSGYPGF